MNWFLANGTTFNFIEINPSCCTCIDDRAEFEEITHNPNKVKLNIKKLTDEGKLHFHHTGKLEKF